MTILIRVLETKPYKRIEGGLRMDTWSGTIALFQHLNGCYLGQADLFLLFLNTDHGMVNINFRNPDSYKMLEKKQ